MDLRRGFLSLLTGSLLLTPFIATADTKPIEQYWDAGPSVKNVGGYTGVLVEDSFEMTNQQSNLVGVYFENNNGNWVQKESFSCTSIADSNCANAHSVWYNAIFKVCQNNADSNCVVGVTAVRNGIEIPGTFAEYYPEKNKFNFKGDAALKVPDGDLPSLWTFNGLNHQGGDKFMVYANYSHFSNYYSGNQQSLEPQQFSAGIFAVSKEKVLNTPEFFVKTGKADVLGKATWWNGANYGCQSTGPNGECAMAWPLPNDVRFKLEIRTSIPITTFMHGRLLDPSITVSNDSQKRQVFKIEAGAVSVPVLNTWVKNTDMPAALHDYLYSMPTWGGFFIYIDGQGGSRDNVQLLQHFNNYNEESFKEYLWWLEVAKDKSVGSKTMWIARTLSGSEIYSAGQQVRNCIQSTPTLTGMVTTNAGMYISSPPTFNVATQSLDYKVSAPHFDEKGGANIGNYNLVLSSATARCIYGFSSAPISANVSVISSDGTTQVATTVVKEKDGWLYLSAAGYGYSNPTVRVKLTQEATPAVTNSQSTTTPATSSVTNVKPTVAPKPVVVKKTTITCVKGKVSKKITAVNPTCPSGYKKK